jgi:acetyltransferase-like isoleucine patch superfamily enzyme
MQEYFLRTWEFLRLMRRGWGLFGIRGQSQSALRDNSANWMENDVRITLTADLKEKLKRKGIENFLHEGAQLPQDTLIEPPSSTKWIDAHYRLRIGAFSYCVSGHLFDVDIGRYTSIGESVQMGRGDHPSHWLTTSPSFYLNQMFDVGNDFPGSKEYWSFKPELAGFSSIPGPKTIHIENDVWIGHGAFVRPGVRIGTGAVVAAYSVVTKDVPPYSIVGSNPARAIKARFPEEIVDRLLRSQWWTRAPWQLAGVDISRPVDNIDLIEKRISETEPYAPGFVSLAELAS